MRGEREPFASDGKQKEPRKKGARSELRHKLKKFIVKVMISLPLTDSDCGDKSFHFSNATLTRSSLISTIASVRWKK